MAREQPVVLVTGASAGFGNAICTRLAAAGYKVYGSSRRLQPEDGAFPFVQMDVDDDASVQSAVAEVVQREGRLDAIVGNAGWGLAGALEDTSTEEAIAQFQTNFFGNHRLCRAALPHLRRRPTAHIVMIGSIAGLVGIPFEGMYSASKFALEGYCQSLRLELHKTPVRVTILEPGDFNTGFTSARALSLASSSSPFHRDGFARALAVFEEQESAGANPEILGAAVQDILENPNPPLRRIVVGPKQADLTGLPSLSDQEIEAMLVEALID
jgi:NAD(P)-dependent dehydrogenase (short-subunit alcohol dehydrogenase family)